MKKKEFLQEYEKLDKKFKVHTDNSFEFLVNFSKIANEPINRWFYFQEGYSPQLVLNIFHRLGINSEKCVVFDPFAGSGTTLLVAKQIGMKSFGFEINPFSYFIKLAVSG